MPSSPSWPRPPGRLSRRPADRPVGPPPRVGEGAAAEAIRDAEAHSRIRTPTPHMSTSGWSPRSSTRTPRTPTVHRTHGAATRHRGHGEDPHRPRHPGRRPRVPALSDRQAARHPQRGGALEPDATSRHPWRLRWARSMPPPPRAPRTVACRTACRAIRNRGLGVRTAQTADSPNSQRTSGFRVPATTGVPRSGRP